MEESVERFTPMSESSLYARIGEREAVEAVVDDFYGSVLDDDLLTGYFNDPAMDDLQAYQIAFVSSVAADWSNIPAKPCTRPMPTSTSPTRTSMRSRATLKPPSARTPFETTTWRRL
jgi:truncated hemoglobin YjbI